MLQWIDDSRHLSADAKQVIYLEAMKHVVRVASGTIDVYMPIITAAVPLMDVALNRHFLKLKAKGLDWKSWLAEQKGIASLLIPIDDIEAVLSATDYQSVSANLARISSSCHTGASVVKIPRDTVAAEVISAIFESIARKAAEADFSEDALAVMRDEVARRIKMVGKKGLCDKRQISGKILNLTGKVIVTSLETEFNMIFTYLLKECALDTKNGIPLMRAEILMGITGGKIGLGEACKVVSEAVCVHLQGLTGRAHHNTVSTTLRSVISYCS